GATRVHVMVNPADVANTESTLRHVDPAARAMGLEIQILNASTSREIDKAFSVFVQERPQALFVGNAPFFASRRVQLILQAAHHRVPASYSGREYVLKRAKPSELPVVQSNKIELVIQPPDRAGAGPHRAANVTQHCRRGDRIDSFCCAAYVRFWGNS